MCYEACITYGVNQHDVVNVGRLVLETFVSFAPEDKKEVMHLDHDPLNNEISNLQWASRTEQVKHRRRQLLKWTTDRQAARLETAKAQGFETWGEFLKVRRAETKAKREMEKNND